MPTRVTNDIRRLRFERGEMTQAALAERVGVTRQTIIAIEQGRYSPSLEMAFEIARALDVPLDQVFHDAAEEEERSPDRRASTVRQPALSALSDRSALRPGRA